MDCCIVNSQCAIRTMSNEQGEPLFCAKDVAVALEYGNSRDAVRRHVGDGDVAKHDTLTNRGILQMLYVNESGLYALILASKLESVKCQILWENCEGI